MRTLAALSLAALAACSTHDKVLVASLVQSPPAPAGLGITTSTQVTVAQLYLGETSVMSPSAGDVKPISGANVQLFDNGVAVAGAVFSETQPGYYQATGSFYKAGDTFRFVATVGPDQYWGEVAGVPGPTTFTLPGTPASGIYTYASYSGMPATYTITRPCTGFCDIAFYGAWTVSGTTFNSSGTPNCTNVPQDPASLVSFALLDDTPWRAPSFGPSTATCFPPPGTGTYVVGLADLVKGTTSTTFGSAIAGTSAAAGVIVSAP